MQKTKNAKTLEYYRRVPYTMYLALCRDSDGKEYWTAEYTELRGCKTDGSTDVEAVANLHELFDEYIETLIEEGIEIPEPILTPIEAKIIWISLPTARVSSDTEETKGVIQFQEKLADYKEIAIPA
jgi:predicted RNase H-like HicB family nuclease